VVLPNAQICEANLITPTSLLNPNKQTLQVVKQARAHERRLQREFNLLSQSQLRGETTEDRVAQQLELESDDESNIGMTTEDQPQIGHVYQLTRFDRRKQRQISMQKTITIEEVQDTVSDTSIFYQPKRGRVREFDHDD